MRGGEAADPRRRVASLVPKPRTVVVDEPRQMRAKAESIIWVVEQTMRAVLVLFFVSVLEVVMLENCSIVWNMKEEMVVLFE
eukprot:scaffold1506_cov179-Amphora_coffeaeformis.AAC.2